MQSRAQEVDKPKPNTILISKTYLVLITLVSVHESCQEFQTGKYQLNHPRQASEQGIFECQRVTSFSRTALVPVTNFPNVDPEKVHSV
jgi:hypothetical protein